MMVCFWINHRDSIVCCCCFCWLVGCFSFWVAVGRLETKLSYVDSLTVDKSSARNSYVFMSSFVAASRQFFCRME